MEWQSLHAHVVLDTGSVSELFRVVLKHLLAICITTHSYGVESELMLYCLTTGIELALGRKDKECTLHLLVRSHLGLVCKHLFDLRLEFSDSSVGVFVTHGAHAALSAFFISGCTTSDLPSLKKRINALLNVNGRGVASKDNRAGSIYEENMRDTTRTHVGRGGALTIPHMVVFNLGPSFAFDVSFNCCCFIVDAEAN